jgi:hypothetical protein
MFSSTRPNRFALRPNAPFHSPKDWFSKEMFWNVETPSSA